MVYNNASSMRCETLQDLIKPLRRYVSACDGDGKEYFSILLDWLDSICLEKAPREEENEKIQELWSRFCHWEKYHFEEEWLVSRELLSHFSKPMMSASRMTHRQMVELDDDDLVDAIFSGSTPEDVADRMNEIVLADEEESCSFEKKTRNSSSKVCRPPLPDHVDGVVGGGPVSFAKSGAPVRARADFDGTLPLTWGRSTFGSAAQSDSDRVPQVNSKHRGLKASL